MAGSQVLVSPHFVRFHSFRESDPSQGLSFLFAPVHVEPGGHLSGWVLANDADNTAGLAHGLNWRADIGKGGPDSNVSWSPFDGDEDEALMWLESNGGA